MTLFSMFSPNKKLDRELLLELGECIQVFADSKHTTSDILELMGRNYTELDQRISTHDYTQEDVSYQRVEDMMNYKVK